MLQVQNETKASYLLKTGASQNNRSKPKQPETSQKDPNPTEMTQNQQKQHPKNVKQPETTQHFKIGNPNFLLALVFQTSSPNS